MTERESTVPPFCTLGFELRCWVIQPGPLPGAARYEWRSVCGRIRVGQDGRSFWSRLDGLLVEKTAPTLKIAMRSAAVRASMTEPTRKAA